MKSTQAQIEELEYQLKAKGLKYFDHVALACFTDEIIEIDFEDITITQELPTKEKKVIISEALRQLFNIVHRHCDESHTLPWRYDKLEGILVTELSTKTWVEAHVTKLGGFLHEIRANITLRVSRFYNQLISKPTI